MVLGIPSQGVFKSQGVLSTMDEQTEIHIGKVRMTAGQARKFIADYTKTGSDPKEKKPSAFPAYDELHTGTGPAELSDGDLLAPAMLNVKITIRAMYGLQHIRAELEQALGSPVFTKTLAQASDDEIASVIEALYSPLDGPEKPQDVGGTKLSKVVHRKRPDFLVLHDVWVNRCYVGKDAPIPVAQKRSWAAYMVELHKAVRDDLTAAGDLWGWIREQVPAAKELTDVRLLDILAWSSRGRLQL